MLAGHGPPEALLRDGTGPDPGCEAPSKPELPFAPAGAFTWFRKTRLTASAPNSKNKSHYQGACAKHHGKVRRVCAAVGRLWGRAGPLLLDRPHFILGENDENRDRIPMLAVSTAVWVAQRKGEIRELSLVVNGIAMFANES